MSDKEINHKQFIDNQAIDYINRAYKIANRSTERDKITPEIVMLADLLRKLEMDDYGHHV